jgi:adhesin transport system outer membrane protein
MMQTRVQAIQGVLVSAQDIVNSVERQFNSGRKSWLELMNAAREMAQTQAQYFDTQIAGTLSSWRLYFIVNGQVTEIQAKYFSTKNKYLQDT